uniref:Response regulatory domain-containing protein n=1 Tax=Leersia perrieri TaxID=77586 RepID=A0A0D9V0A1_9ORYZ
MGSPPPNVGGRRQKLHGLVVVEDGAVQDAMVMKLTKINCQATVCSDINVAVKLLRERMKEIDIVVVSDALSRLKPAINSVQLLCEEAQLRLTVLRKDNEKDDTWVLVSYSHMEQELESIRRSTMNKDDLHAYRLPVAMASSHCNINGLTMTTMAMEMVAMPSLVKRATNRSKHQQQREKFISTQGQDVQEQSTQHQQKKRRLVWTTELNKKFVEAYEKLSLTGDLSVM